MLTVILSDQLVGGGKNVLQQIGSKTCHRSPCVWPNSSRAWLSTAIGPSEGTLVRYAASGRVIDRGVHHPLFVSAGHAGRDQFFSASGQPNSQRSAVWGQALSGYPPPLRCRCRSRARASLRNRHQGPSIMGFEDEAEQSYGRPCRQSSGRSKQTYELTSSIVPRGTSFHRSAELGFSSYRV